jgi:hypothetical protein
VPGMLSYWLLMVISTISMTVLAEYLCMMVELKEIPLSLVPKADL